MLAASRGRDEAADGAGANEIVLIQQAMAAAMGAGLPIDQPCGSMIVNIGAGTTEIGVISLLGSVYSDSLRIAGDSFNARIVTYLRRQYGCLIGEATAEHIKQEIGMALVLPEQAHQEMEVRGRHLSAGVPAVIKVNAQEISQVLQEPLKNIIDAIKNTLEDMPAELSGDGRGRRRTADRVAGGRAAARAAGASAVRALARRAAVGAAVRRGDEGAAADGGVGVGG